MFLDKNIIICQSIINTFIRIFVCCAEMKTNLWLLQILYHLSITNTYICIYLLSSSYISNIIAKSSKNPCRVQGIPLRRAVSSRLSNFFIHLFGKKAINIRTQTELQYFCAALKINEKQFP